MWLRIILLAVVQGVTEFLPVSSSGHLVILQHFAGMDAPGQALEVMLHLGSLFSILFFFRSRIIFWLKGLFAGDHHARRFFFALLVSMVPVLVAYPLAHKWFDDAFESPRFAALMLLCSGVVLLSLYRLKERTLALDISKGIMIGFAQVFALLPGISRSGITIVTARHVGLSADDAVEFSFLMSIPLLALAGLRQAIRLDPVSCGISPLILVTGLFVSALVGYVALFLLVKLLKSHRFRYFGWYCLAAGGIGLMVL